MIDVVLQPTEVTLISTTPSLTRRRASFSFSRPPPSVLSTCAKADCDPTPALDGVPSDWSKGASSGGATGGNPKSASGSSKTPLRIRFAPPFLPLSRQLATDRRVHSSLSHFAGSCRVGAITGGVVGGVVALALVALLFFLLRRRRSHRFGAVRTAEKEFWIDQNGPDEHLGATNSNGSQPVTPFTYSQTGSPSVGLASSEATTAGMTTGSLFLAGEMSGGPNGTVVGNPLRLVSTPPATSPDALESSSGPGPSSVGKILTKGQMAERERESQVGGSQGARRERDEDAGPVPAHEAEPFLPPAYEQVRLPFHSCPSEPTDH